MPPAIFEKLRQALSQIDRPGSFCVSGSVPAVLPGLEVADLGPIGMPLTSPQAQELKKLCEQAPYGKGEETLVDTSVRRVWRMEPDRFALTNPDWQPFLKRIVRTVQQELGLEKQKLDCHLYDLLLYEPGSFFLPHRDGEKLKRMVATLVVVLPSSFEGGELVVRHDGQEQTIDFSSAPNSPFQIHYAAFYADCEHEIRPLRQGYRLCLVYNLTLAKAKKKTISAPRASEHIQTINHLLREWSTDDAARKLAITLDHQYTQDGLAWDALKGVDRARANVLREAARQAGCQANLALLTFWESGSAEYAGGGGYGYGRRRRWYDDDYEEEDAGEYEMGEIFDSSLTADGWIDREGNRLTIGPLTVDEDEVLDPDVLEAVEPEEDFEGYTGNAGMTLERWYRHAAIILWPEARHFEILCDNDGRKVVPLLEQMESRWRQADASDAETLKTQCLGLAAAILTTWGARPYPYGYEQQPETGALLKTLLELDDPKLIAVYLGTVLIKDVSVEPGKSLPAVCERYGWGTFQPELVAVMKSTNAQTLKRNVRVLEQTCLAKPRPKEGWLELCAALAQALVQALEALDRGQADNDWRAPHVDRAEVLAGLARSLLATEQVDLLGRVVAHALASPKKYPLRLAHMPALVSLRPWLEKHVKQPCAVLAQWLASCREQLEVLTAEAPQAPADFRRTAALTCKCQYCNELKQFLEDPRESVHRFRLRQDLRSHLENSIRQDQCDVDCQTDRHGSPHTLVCTKNTASYQAKLRTYQQDQEHLATLLAIQATLPK
jgi:hypothetical protein